MKIEEIGPAAKRELALLDKSDDEGLTLPVASGQGIVQALTAYREIQNALDKSMPDQIITIRDKRFRKKGYWRAVATAFGLRLDCVQDERINPDLTDDWGYRVTYRAYAPKGNRYTDGDGVCMASEKNRGDMKATEHNVRSHAHTRAFNRAVSNIVGFGEVSAEEISDEERTTGKVDNGNTIQDQRIRTPDAKREIPPSGSSKATEIGVEITGIYLGQSPKGLKLEIGDKEPEWYPKSAVISPRKWDWKEGQGVTLTIAKWLAQSKGFVDKEPVPPDNNIPY